MKEYASEAESAAKARDRLADFENSIPGPLNLKFDQGEIGRLPEGWFVPALPKDADLWAQLRNRGCMLRPSCAVVLAPETAPAHVGNLMQSFSAAAYRGKTVVLKAWLRLDAEEREDRAQMWLAVDRPNNRRGFFDDMKDRPVRGPDWTHCEIRTEVDADAAYIKFGVMSFGRGKVWVDGVSFETARP